jgi:uncharacterized HhH-GPD family protein
MAVKAADASLAWTNDPDAAALIAQDPLALLIGFLLDQQVPMEWAFGAPHTLKQRLGEKLDARAIAEMEPEALDAAFRAKPPLHRYPGSMAKRTRTLCRIVVDEYRGEAAHIWDDGAGAGEVARRIARLPGFSANKAHVIIGTLAKRLGAPLPGWENYSPSWFSLADVDSPEALIKYRELKRAGKKSGNWPPRP